MRKAVFLDRDGVIIALKQNDQAVSFVCKKEEVVILPGVREALNTLKSRGYTLVVITNQPAVARGLMTIEEVEALHKFINDQLGNVIDRFCFCPHHPELHPDVPEHAKKFRIACDCRKPLPGMIIQAAEELGLDPKQSWMIGDMVSDVVTGIAAGCRTIMLKSAANDWVIKSSQPFDATVKPDRYAADLLEATRFID